MFGVELEDLLLLFLDRTSQEPNSRRWFLPIINCRSLQPFLLPFFLLKGATNSGKANAYGMLAINNGEIRSKLTR